MSEFDKIAGYKEEKQELINLCNLIKNREKLYKVGGKLPRGLFLIGPNGVGKTIMAKSFIKESGCDVVSVSYNDINDDDEFNGYIRDKFKEASEKVPCILLIDELDKLIGNGSHFFIPESFSKSRVVLNEINKYGSCEGLFLLVAANEEFIIDESIIRSGRIDKVIRVSLPNEKERLSIIKYYLKNKKCSYDFDVNRVTKLTHGFSGADIEALLNNSIIKAFNEDRDYITYSDVVDTFYKKLFSTSEKEAHLNDECLKVIAYHEAGHAVMSALYGEDIDYATILPRDGANGFIFNKTDETIIPTFRQVEQRIQVCLAGMASEEMFMHNRTMGASKDIEMARKLVTNLVRKNAYSGFETIAITYNSLTEEAPSNERRCAMEAAEDKLLNDMYTEVNKILSDNKDLVEAVAKELLDKKILNREQILGIIEKTKELEALNNNLSKKQEGLTTVQN